MSHQYSKLMFGIVAETFPDKGLVRVSFDEDNLSSGLLPYVVPTSTDAKFIFPLAVGAQVACVMDEHAEYGVCLGSTYNDEDVPDGGAPGVFRIVFSDGAEIEYNTEGHRLHFKVGTTEVHVADAGITIKRGGEDLKAIVTDLLAAIKALTVTTSTGPSGPPINIADFIAIETRVPNLFE